MSTRNERARGEVALAELSLQGAWHDLAAGERLSQVRVIDRAGNEARAHTRTGGAFCFLPL